MIVIKPETISISMSPTMEDKKEKRKKRVNWSDSCRVRPFRRVKPSEQDLCWYGQKDYREFKKERKAAAMLAEAIGLEAIEETDFVTTRGIEYMVDKNLYERKVKVQRRACVAVLSAQLKLFDTADAMGETANLISSDLIYCEYSKYSRPAHAEASVKALQEWESSGEQGSSDSTAQHDNLPPSEQWPADSEDENRESSQKTTVKKDRGLAQLRKKLSFTRRRKQCLEAPVAVAPTTPAVA